MNILVITHFYELDGVMGSVRWTSFAHRLAKSNHVIVVTHGGEQAAPYMMSREGNIDVIRIDNECAYVKRGAHKAKNRSNEQPTIVQTVVHKQKSDLRNVVRCLLYLASMKQSAAKNALSIIRCLHHNRIQIDCIVSTSRPFIDALLGLQLAKRLHSSWLLDQRDLQYNDGDSDFTIRRYASEFRKMDRFVSAYTLVSHGMAESFARDCKFSLEEQKRIHVINNGYARESIPNQKAASSNRLTIAYAGDLYSGRRDAEILFRAIALILQKNPSFPLSEIEIQYAGDEGYVLKEQAEKFNLHQIIKSNGRLSHDRAMKMMQDADMLLLLTWNTKMDRGILPGKLYEYMMLEKPIICVTCGDEPGGEAESMINQMNLGIAINQLNGTPDIEKLARYLELQYYRKRDGQPLLFTPNIVAVRSFDYDNLTKKLEALLSDITQ